MTVEITTIVWDRNGIELTTPDSAVRHASVARHVTDCATRHGANYVIQTYNMQPETQDKPIQQSEARYNTLQQS